MTTRWSVQTSDGEDAQMMLMFALLLSVICMTLGLAVEGGHLFAESRKMQSAVDMAALVGAQKLPCLPGAACNTTAIADACATLQANGYGGGYSSATSNCAADGTSTPSASVPPISCSPYDFVDYGNAKTNTFCQKTGHNYATVTRPFYIETRIARPIRIPIFNIGFTMFAHAIAKQGFPSPKDFAISILNPVLSGAFTAGGNSQITTIGSVMVNSESASAYNTCGLVCQACDGAWFTSGSGTDSGLSTYVGGVPNFSSPSCGTAVKDGVDQFYAGVPQIADPYGTTALPPTQSGTYPNCPQCAQNGIWYDLKNSSWSSTTPPALPPDVNGGDIELFPGVYHNITVKNGDNLYFNPGVYTFTGTWDLNHGNMCVFGAPDCDINSCGTQEFSPGSDTGNQWYFQCSPWGFYDTRLVTSAGAPTSLATTPSFYNEATGSPDSSRPLNGVTFYFTTAGITEHGNTGQNDSVYLAFPNPCPGTGTTYVSGSPNFSNGRVQFPQGYSTGVFNEPSSSVAYKQGYAASPAGQVYPNADFTLAGECANDTYMVWPDEFGPGVTQGQHLHFFYFSRLTPQLPTAPPDTTINENGASGQSWWGIIYDPNRGINISGAGKGATGEPWITGQIVADHATFSGNSAIDVYYRPCPAGSACSSGPGTALVE